MRKITRRSQALVRSKATYLLSLLNSLLLLLILTLLFVITFAQKASAADTGFQHPSSTGSPSNNWKTGSNAFTSNNSYAQSSSTGRFQDYVFNNLQIPASATIDGIIISAEASCHAIASLDGESATLGVQLSYNAGSNYTAQKTSEFLLANGEVVQNLGSATDTWGRSWIDTEFSSTSFRVRINETAENACEFYGLLGADTNGVDQLRVKVFYTPTSSISTSTTPSQAVPILWKTIQLTIWIGWFALGVIGAIIFIRS